MIFRKRKAFTLVEILIVVAVIGILFVALVPRIDFAGDSAREAGIKSDFRNFQLAAEQYLREKIGLEECENISDLCADDKMNMYLDNGMKFDPMGECEKEDPWNGKYTVQVIKENKGDPKNGAIVFICNGRDHNKHVLDDNYTATVIYDKGEIRSSTEGFSNNIESGIYTTGGPWQSFSECAEREFVISYKW
ncbi:MAG: type II secretion system GspH family protein [Firmicutes bacterium]|nr:type II secretion system GspH family protein [Bacillota bacterium]